MTHITYYTPEVFIHALKNLRDTTENFKLGEPILDYYIFLNTILRCLEVNPNYIGNILSKDHFRRILNKSVKKIYKSDYNKYNQDHCITKKVTFDQFIIIFANESKDKIYHGNGSFNPYYLSVRTTSKLLEFTF